MSSTSKHERYAAGQVAPLQSATPGLGITRLASSTTAAKVDLTTLKHMFGKRLCFKNESTTAGDALFISFSATGAVDVDAAASAGATMAAGTTTAQGFKLLPGETVVWVLNSNEHKWLHWDAAANTPTLCIFPCGRNESRA